MARRMGQEQHLVPKVVIVGDEDAAPMQEEPLRKAPRRVELARLQLLPQSLGIR